MKQSIVISKTLLERLKIEKNIPKTLAMRHQSLMSLYSTSKNFLAVDNINSTGLKEEHVDAFNPVVREKLVKELKCEKFPTAYSVTIHGTLYRPDFVVASEMSEGVLYFAKIDKIIVHHSESSVFGGKLFRLYFLSKVPLLHCIRSIFRSLLSTVIRYFRLPSSVRWSLH